MSRLNDEDIYGVHMQAVSIIDSSDIIIIDSDFNLRKYWMGVIVLMKAIVMVRDIEKDKDFWNFVMQMMYEVVTQSSAS